MPHAADAKHSYSTTTKLECLIVQAILDQGDGWLDQPPKEATACFARLDPEVFKSPTARMLYEAARTLAARGRPWGALAIQNFLDEAGQDPRPFFATLFEHSLDFEGLPSWTIRDGVDKLVRIRHRGDLWSWHEDGLGALAPELQDPPSTNGVTPWVDEANSSRLLVDWLDAGLRTSDRISLGLAPLDRILGGGLMPGELCIVGARTGIGKTALLCQIALNSFLKGRRFGYFSAEMSAGQIIGRMALSRAEDPERVAEFAIEIDGADFRVFDRCSQVAMVAHECQAAGRFDLVLVDHLSIFRDPKVAKQGRVQEVSAISRDLKLLAGDLQCPVIAACQLNRQPAARDDGRPKLSDLRDSGSIEQDADQVILLHDAWRAWADMDAKQRSKDDEPPRKKLDAIVAKNRRGDTGTAALRFDRHIQRIEPWENA